MREQKYADGYGQHERKKTWQYQDLELHISWVKAFSNVDVGVDTHCQSWKETTSGGVHQELQEDLVVLEANAVAHPRTVVVHLEHAPLTQAAVMGPRWLDLLALVAVTKHEEALKFTVAESLAVFVSVAVVLRKNTVNQVQSTVAIVLCLEHWYLGLLSLRVWFGFRLLRWPIYAVHFNLVVDASVSIWALASRPWEHLLLRGLFSDNLLALKWLSFSLIIVAHPWINAMHYRCSLPISLNVEVVALGDLLLWDHAILH